MSAGNPATDFSVALLGELIDRGVRDIVVCPGSRSQALALAARAFETAGRVRLRVRIDERVAGFLALGLAAETHRPVVVITTSGTAVANLHPAVLEAHHSGIPLILLTADRPLDLRGIGSNQTTDQVGIFGSAVGWVREVEAPRDGDAAGGFDASYPVQLAHEAYSAAAGHSTTEQPRAAGPVQLDLAFREPLSGVVGDLPEARQHLWGEGSPRHPHTLIPAPNTVVIAGNAAGADAEATARALNAPLLAEVSSGARFGPNLVVSYRELLRNEEFGGRVERAIVFGHPTLSREIPALLQREGVEFIVVRRPGGEDYNPGHRAAKIVDAVVVDGEPSNGLEARAWVGRWVHRSRELLEVATPTATEPLDDLAREQLAAFREPVTRRILAESVWGVTWPHDRLVLGASRLIREVDGVVTGKRISVHSNRGLAGIDGTVSTALGIALASQAEAATQAGTTRVLLGDLTLLHDSGALLFPTGEPRPRIQVIVGNDGGGTIFDGLEVAGVATADDFDRVQFTPQTAKLGALADAFGWEYVLASNRGELSEALGRTDGQLIIEVPLPRD